MQENAKINFFAGHPTTIYDNVITIIMIEHDNVRTKSHRVSIRSSQCGSVIVEVIVMRSDDDDGDDDDDDDHDDDS